MKSLSEVLCKFWDVAVITAIVIIMLTALGCPPTPVEAESNTFDDLVFVGFNFGYHCAELKIDYDTCLSDLQATIKE